MRKSEIDDLLGVMLESHDNVSDLNITCERPLQVEAAGELVPVPVDPAIENLTPFQTEIFALNLVNNDRRLTEHLLRQGSCDSSYSLPGRARFRVNIFSQRGNFSIVLRKLETMIPTIEELKLPEAFKKMPGEKIGGGRWAVHDILANTIRSNELIMNGEQEGKTFYDVQEVGEPYLMITFDQALLRSYEQGIITEETAIAYSTRKSVVQRGIDHVKQKRGEKTTTLEGLRLDMDYNRKLGKR